MRSTLSSRRARMTCSAARYRSFNALAEAPRLLNVITSRLCDHINGFMITLSNLLHPFPDSITPTLDRADLPFPAQFSECAVDRRAARPWAGPFNVGHLEVLRQASDGVQYQLPLNPTPFLRYELC
jgi:hypothetical protein